MAESYSHRLVIVENYILLFGFKGCELNTFWDALSLIEVSSYMEMLNSAMYLGTALVKPSTTNLYTAPLDHCVTVQYITCVVWLQPLLVPKVVVSNSL